MLSSIKQGDKLDEFPQGSHISPIEMHKRWPNLSPRSFMRRETTGSELVSAAEDPQLAFYRNAAHKDTIMALLARLAMLKPFAGTEIERAYKIKDYTLRLAHYQVKEIDLFEAVEEIVDNDMNDFFPSYAKLHRRIFGTSEAKTYD